VVGTLGIDADLSCAAGRRRDGYPVVTGRRAVSRQKETPSTLAQDLNTGAVAALDKAREMPPGDERTEAIHKAMVFRNAAEIHQLLGRKRGAPDL
jgi:hypothetical protein